MVLSVGGEALVWRGAVGGFVQSPDLRASRTFWFFQTQVFVPPRVRSGFPCLLVMGLATDAFLCFLIVPGELTTAPSSQLLLSTRAA